MQQAALRVLWAAPLQRAQGALSLTLQQALTLAAPSAPSTSTASLTVDAPASAQSWHCSGPFQHSAGARAGLRTAPAPSSSRAAPSPSASPSCAFSVEIAVQGFEKRYVDMACNAIDDMVMLAFAPKSFDALPTGSPSPSDAPVALAFGAARRDVRLPWRRTRFTVIRGPHIDKTGMEQFERREYKSVLTAATNNAEELRRLLEGVKIYQFTGVQLRIDVTSAQTLALPQDLLSLLGRGSAADSPAAPASSSSSSAVAEAQGEGAAWAAAEPQLGRPVATIPAPRSPEAAFEAELSAVLDLLRPLVLQPLKEQARAGSAEREYKAWRERQRALPPAPAADGAAAADAAAAEGAAAAGGDAYEALLRQRLRQQEELLLAAGAEAPRRSGEGQGTAVAAAYRLSPGKAAHLLAKIDAELLRVHRAALQEAGQDAPAAPPPAAAAAVAAPALDASAMSPAEYVSAALQYVRQVDEMAAAAAASATRADAELQLAAPALALRLLQMWAAATSIEFKRYLGIPPQSVVDQIEEAKAAQAKQYAERLKKAEALAPPPAASRGAAAAAAAVAAFGEKAQKDAAAPAEPATPAAEGREGKNDRRAGGGGSQGSGGRGPRRGGGRQQH